MTRYIIAALMLTLTACVDQLPATEQCGGYPAHGHYSAAYELRGTESVVVLSRADFDQMVADAHATKEWALCVAGE